MSQRDIDEKNAAFWNELCGTTFARSLGITEITLNNLRRFDKEYLTFYPYLSGYALNEDLRGKKVLEIGLGYGTLGNLLALHGSDYYGLDIAEGPVAMMRYRLTLLGQNPGDRIQVGSALEIPHQDSSFDYVYTIGCLHHTGNISKAVGEVYRVLVPGGKAIVMLYNRHSFRQFFHVPLIRLLSLLTADKRASFAARVRALYDINQKGEVAPHTDYVSRAEVRRLFGSFSSVRIDIQNFDSYVILRGKWGIPRDRLLNNIGRVLGLDFYVVATK